SDLQLGIRVAGGQLVAVLQVQVVVLDTDATRPGQRLLDGDEVVVALPVGVDDVVGAHGAAPRLATVDVGADADHVVLRHDQGVGTTEGAVQEVGVVVDVVVRGEDRSIDVLGRQVRAQLGMAVGVFLRGEGGLDLFTVADAECFGHLHDENPSCYSLIWHTGLAAVEDIATEPPGGLLHVSDLKLVRFAGLPNGVITPSWQAGAARSATGLQRLRGADERAKKNRLRGGGPTGSWRSVHGCATQQGSVDTLTTGWHAEM